MILSNDNPQTSKIIYPQINEDGSKTFTYDSSDAKFGAPNGEVVTFDSIVATYSKDNKLLEQTFINGGEKQMSQSYDINGEVTKVLEY